MAKEIIISDDELSSVAKRFWSKVNKTDTCWLWTSALSVAGYGVFMLHDKNLMLAHRVAYTLCKGPIPIGKSLDHLCRNTACCNPDHVEPVSHKENIRRGRTSEATKARASAQTHCRHGHPYDETSRTKSGHRLCRSCEENKLERRYEAWRQKKRKERAEQQVRYCVQCLNPLPVDARVDKIFCSPKCHKRSKDNYRSTRKSRAKGSIIREAGWG